MGIWISTFSAVIDVKLYGKDGADDGYALPSFALLIKAMDDLQIPHGKIVYIGENEEESEVAIDELHKKIKKTE